ncbi:Ankyrin repeat domain containing protein [Acanthamoeba castellanii str. Neff]|uniref:Ankyrin repeat domain containing protein n=1 Tax=Acanthamoeba castellanii (strain ATCC 30010 / Neff) TaxID=1257118 RepID=L8H7K6_ACACF|nr:Ankyrin repeat domain containing protein [Acanthamoeba castellanii str. Neff]ELR20466.1 Ankyrin repeat domain containing protein [Acanthamoeba castellanii str. Neff]
MEQQQREGAAFLEAAATGNVLEARRFLQNSPRLVDFVDRLGWVKRGRTGLLVAVEARHVKMVELLLASGADPHHRSSVDGMHALHVLAEQGQRDFLSADADEVEERKAAGKLLDILLDAGVDPNVPTTSGETVLHLMCLRGNIDGVRELLARRLVADIDARNTHGDTALHYASRKGHQEIVRLLVAHGASPAAESQFGTPGQVASESRQDHITELLRSLSRHHTDGDDDNDDHDLQRLGLWSLPPEVVVHALSFVANARDLCSVSLTCRALAAISRDDGLWKPLGHPSWADHQVAYAPFLSLHSIPDSCMT